MAYAVIHIHIEKVIPVELNVLLLSSSEMLSLESRKELWTTENLGPPYSERQRRFREWLLMYDIGFCGPICQMIPRDTEVMAVKCSAWTDGSGGTTSRRLQQIVYQLPCDLFYSCFTDTISRLDVVIPFRRNSGQNPVPRNLSDNTEHPKYKSVCLLSWNKNGTNPIDLLHELRCQNLKLYFTFDFKFFTFIIFSQEKFITRSLIAYTHSQV
jgi:hypothetical protein